MFRIATAALALASLLAPLGGALPDSHAPTAVIVGPGIEETVVSFVIGVTPADFYNVYGVTEAGAYVLLSQTTPAESIMEIEALVPAGYADYVVSGVLDGVESARVGAGAHTPCLFIVTSHLPPVVYIDPYCPLPADPPTWLLDKVQLPTIQKSLIP